MTTDSATLTAHDFVTAEADGEPITFDFSDPRGMTLKWPWPLALIGRKHMRGLPLKRVENRPKAWKTGTYFLHAGQGVDDAGIIWLRDLGADVPDEPLFSGIFAVANIPSVCSASVGLRRLFCACGTFAVAGEHHHALDVLPLTRSVAHRGTLGPWRPSSDAVAAVREQVARPSTLAPEIFDQGDGRYMLMLRCRGCGCTEDRACEGGCWWVEDPRGGNLCSACRSKEQSR